MTGTTLTIVLVVLLVAALWQLRHYRAKFEQTGLVRAWPIEKVTAGAIDPALVPGELGPPLGAETYFLPELNVLGGIGDFETWVLSAVAKQSTCIFEFGTCTGKTTYLLARNAPADAEVITLTLPPDQRETYVDGVGDARGDRIAALKESAFSSFYYQGTPVEARVTQLFADSKTFDETPYLGKCDLIFIDGAHAASYVESDSRKALRMVKPGGLVFWHDYRGPGRSPGVFRTLNMLAKELPLRHVAKTSLVFLRAAHQPSNRAG
ncbi:hypothetical protein BH11GEM2_BH11GEM2_36510 [soil metagenome]